MTLHAVAEAESARLATPDDIATIAEIRGQHLAGIEGQRGASLLLDYELPNEGFIGELQLAVQDEQQLLVVGTYDEVVFGYGWASVATLSSGGLLGRLREFVVHAEIRKSGIGEAIMNFAMADLEARGCVGVDSLALPGDRDTKNFFESFGLKARLLTVHRTFPSSPGDAEGGRVAVQSPE